MEFDTRSRYSRPSEFALPETEMGGKSYSLPKVNDKLPQLPQSLSPSYESSSLPHVTPRSVSPTSRPSTRSVSPTSRYSTRSEAVTLPRVSPTSRPSTRSEAVTLPRASPTSRYSTRSEAVTLPRASPTSRYSTRSETATSRSPRGRDSFELPKVNTQYRRIPDQKSPYIPPSMTLAVKLVNLLREYYPEVYQTVLSRSGVVESLKIDFPEVYENLIGEATM
jgi:hypothetical protein